MITIAAALANPIVRRLVAFVAGNASIREAYTQQAQRLAAERQAGVDPEQAQADLAVIDELLAHVEKGLAENAAAEAAVRALEASRQEPRE